MHVPAEARGHLTFRQGMGSGLIVGRVARCTWANQYKDVLVRAKLRRHGRWGRRRRGETVIGEDGSRKGKRGGGEALEAPGSTWCTRYHYITLSTPRRPLFLFPPLLLPLSARSLASYSPTYLFFPFSDRQKVAASERGKRKGPRKGHRMIAVLI